VPSYMFSLFSAPSHTLKFIFIQNDYIKLNNWVNTRDRTWIGK